MSDNVRYSVVHKKIGIYTYCLDDQHGNLYPLSMVDFLLYSTGLLSIPSLVEKYVPNSEHCQ